MRIWERSIATQFICLMLLALLLSQAISALISWDERGVSFLLARELPRWKRAIDVVTAGIGLVLLAPLMLLIAALILVTSGRPVVFEQWRTGKGFRRFRMYKFRTMASEAGAGWGEVQHLNEMTGPLFKSSKDPRVLGFGKLLRKTSMDELPQLVNVLKGEMSLVGPRPGLPYEVELYHHWHRRRFAVLPGITDSGRFVAGTA